MTVPRSSVAEGQDLDVVQSPPCVVFALAREAMFFWKIFPARARVRGAPCPAWLAGPPDRTVLVLESGLGGAAVGSVVGWAVGRPCIANSSAPYRMPFLVLAGFSGALQAGLKVGELIEASEVIDERGGSWPASLQNKSDRHIERGRVLTADGLVGDPREKLALGERFGAAAVDMESAVAARICREHGVPFGCLRAISDRSDTQLSPRLIGLLRSGRPAPLSVIATVLRSPGIAAELWSLARSTRLAARNLADGLVDLLSARTLTERTAS
jgi:adenosylhomocysteine nucleosidase